MMRAECEHALKCPCVACVQTVGFTRLNMCNKPLRTVLLLAGVLSLQPAISANKAKSATGDSLRQLTAAGSWKTPTLSGMGGAFSYECDDACLLPGAPVPAGKYAVVSPVGKQTVQMITQAPRLDTLNGKTIAVVGGSFMANITHPEIKRLILANYPTAKGSC